MTLDLARDLFGAPPDARIRHDVRGAPYLASRSGAELPPMASFTDEGPWSGVAWADCAEVAGIGIDLAERGEFALMERDPDLARAVFTERELDLIGARYPEDFDLGATIVFAGKEAAFKSTSHAIRRLANTDGLAGACGQAGASELPEELPNRRLPRDLYFEIRDFEISLAGKDGGRKSHRKSPNRLERNEFTATGIKRFGDAERGLGILGIGTIKLRYRLVRNMVLCLAVAQR